MAKGNSGLSKNKGGGGNTQTAIEVYTDASANYTVDYKPYKLGQITKTEAGQVYKAVKNGDVTAKPELTKQLYNETNAYLGLAVQRYNQDGRYYDSVYGLTHALLNNDFKTAQKLINSIEDNEIKLAGKKSIWFKYKK